MVSLLGIVIVVGDMLHIWVLTWTLRETAPRASKHRKLLEAIRALQRQEMLEASGVGPQIQGLPAPPPTSF